MRQKLGKSFDEKKARTIYREEMSRRSANPTPRPMQYNPAQRQQPAATPTIAPSPLGQVLGYQTDIDHKTLPTYNNQKELQRVNPYLQVIQRAAQENGIPPQVLAAALWRESGGFNPKYITGRHVDGTGRGIAGIDAKQRADVPDSVAYDTNQAIPWMAKTLKTYQDQEKGNTYNALRRYNGGPAYSSNRIGYNGLPVSQLTKKHADYIMANSQNLAPLFNSDSGGAMPSSTPNPLNNY